MANKNNEPKDVMEEVLGGDVDSPKPVLLGRDGKPLRRSYKKSGDGFKASVTLDGYKVFISDIKPAVLNELITVNNNFVAETARIQKQQQGNVIKAQEAADRAMGAVATRQAAHYDFLKKVILAWELPDDEEGATLPCTPEAIDDLPFPVAFELANSVQQAATIGASAESFLSKP